MKSTLLIVAIFISGLITAQTKVTVTLTSTFTPSSVTINVGDTVEFVNASGFHWVDGRQSTYPGNPVSFDNQSQSGSGWTYAQVFNTAGFYDYRCGIHTATMTGSITVQQPTGVNDLNEEVEVNDFYPNPSLDYLFFPEYEHIGSVAIYAVTGEQVLSIQEVTARLDISSLSAGTYFVKVTTKDGEASTKKVIVQQ